MEINKTCNGDALEEIKKLTDNSVDLLCTDPPYGMSFMGKDWDKALPDPEVFKECFRVLKPGSFAFVMTAPRSDLQSRMALLLEDAGFNIAFTPIYWAYASGFPKAMDISKAIDKRLNTVKQVGVRQDGMSPTAMKPDKGWNQNKMGREVPILEPNSPQAKELEGLKAGFQPKPAVEVIIVAMKPLSERTYVDQALKSLEDDNVGRGGTWIDGCRIPISESDKHVNLKKKNKKQTSNNIIKGFGNNTSEVGDWEPDGRFPANLLVSDDVLNDGEIRKSPSGKVKRQPRNAQVFTSKNCGFKSENLTDSGFGDSGSFSRYFDIDAWWAKKLTELPERVQKTHPFLITPKASKSEKNRGLEDRVQSKVNDGRKARVDNPFQRGETLRKNTHPTVKPLKLMSWLITLGSREGDVVLDPYSGSGTTLIAAKLLKRKFVGFESESEYCEIAEARIKSYTTSEPLSTYME